MVLTSTNNLCFEQKYEKYQSFFLSENFQFLEVRGSIYLNRRVFVMEGFLSLHWQLSSGTPFQNLLSVRQALTYSRPKLTSSSMPRPISYTKFSSDLF